MSSEDQYDYMDERPCRDEVYSLMMDPELQLSTNSLGTKNVSFKMPPVVIDDLHQHDECDDIE